MPHPAQDCMQILIVFIDQQESEFSSYLNLLESEKNHSDIVEIILTFTYLAK